MTHPILLKDVHKALFSMDPSKVPEIDGFPNFFIKKIGISWKRIYYTLSKMLFGFEFYHMRFWCLLVVLIPKLENSERLKPFRLISLWTILCKLMTNVIVNHLKLVPPDLFAMTQSSLVPKWQITNNIIVVQEMVHYMKRRRSGKGLMLVKLDLEKAYDRLNWNSLRDTLHSIGLPHT